MFEFWWFFIPLGVFVGVTAGLLGVGGGLIMVPSFAYIFGFMTFPDGWLMQYALGSSMAAIVATSMASMLAHHRRGAVLWQAVIAMAPGIAIGAYLATLFVSSVSGKFLSSLFALFMSYVALQLLLNRKPTPSRSLPNKVGLASFGLLSGGVSAMFSIGGGTLNVPFLSWCNVALNRAIGTSAALGVPIAVAGTLGYIINAQHTGVAYTTGFIYWPAVIMVSAVSVLFTPVGATLAHRLPVAVIKKLFAALIVILTCRLLLSVWL